MAGPNGFQVCKYGNCKTSRQNAVMQTEQTPIKSNENERAFGIFDFDQRRKRSKLTNWNEFGVIPLSETTPNDEEKNERTRALFLETSNAIILNTLIEWTVGRM